MASDLRIREELILEELKKLAVSFGMSQDEAGSGISEMAAGTISNLFESGMPADEVMGLIPVKPLGEEEAGIRDIYRSNSN
jgi:pyrroline-5-carboxylate reductase